MNTRKYLVFEQPDGSNSTRRAGAFLVLDQEGEDRTVACDHPLAEVAGHPLMVSTDGTTLHLAKLTECTEIATAFPGVPPCLYRVRW